MELDHQPGSESLFVRVPLAVVVRLMAPLKDLAASIVKQAEFIPASVQLFYKLLYFG